MADPLGQHLALAGPTGTAGKRVQMRFSVTSVQGASATT